MKIALILPSLAHTGPILVARDIVSTIKEKIDLIHVYYFDPIEEVQFDCPTFRIPFNQTIDFSNYDIVHSHMYRPDKYVSVNRKQISAACVSTVHCDVRTDLKYNYNVLISWVFRWVWLYYFSKQDKLVFISRDLKDRYYRKFFPEKKMAVVYNGRRVHDLPLPESDELSHFNALRARGLKILGACALLTRRKGLHQVIEALAHLIDYAFVIIGEGKERTHLEQLAHEYGVADRCIFMGFKAGAEKYMPYFDVYMMPSLYEGFGLALIEAAMLGKSCVCSDISVFEELFDDQQVTFFQQGNVSSLVSAIHIAYQEREQRGKRAAQAALNQYSLERMGNGYLEVYKQLIHAKD